MTEVASKVVVSDNGTGFVKAGFGGDNLPRLVFPSIIGRPVLRAEEEAFGDVRLKALMVGNEASKYRHLLDLRYPVENGIIQSWEDMEIIWDYTFLHKMKLNCPDYRVMLTEAPLNPRKNRVKMIERMFEKYEFEGVYVAIQAMLTLYASGSVTGCVVDSGDGVSHVVAVYEGFTDPNLVTRLNCAGRHLTDYFVKLLQMRGYSFSRTADFQTIQEIKEKICYVASNIADERVLAEETTSLVCDYKLPDGRTITVGKERFEAPEALFNPSMIGLESPGIAQLVFNTIQSAPVDCRREYYRTIVLSGGSTMFPGFATRLHEEVKNLYLKNVGTETSFAKLKMRIEDSNRRKNMVFTGAAVLGQIIENNDDVWMLKKDYDEMGAERLVASRM